MECFGDHLEGRVVSVHSLLQEDAKCLARGLSLKHNILLKPMIFKCEPQGIFHKLYVKKIQV